MYLALVDARKAVRETEGRLEGWCGALAALAGEAARHKAGAKLLAGDRLMTLLADVFGRYWLWRCLGLPVADWALVPDARGKPELRAGGLPSGRLADCQVGLAHSGGWLACVAARRAVGVDVELVADAMALPDGELVAMAQACLGPRVAGRLAGWLADDPAGGRRWFYEAWTAAEARGKLDGRGWLAEGLAAGTELGGSGGPGSGAGLDGTAEAGVPGVGPVDDGAPGSGAGGLVRHWWPEPDCVVGLCGVDQAGLAALQAPERFVLNVASLERPLSRAGGGDGGLGGLFDRWTGEPTT